MQEQYRNANLKTRYLMILSFPRNRELQWWFL